MLPILFQLTIPAAWAKLVVVAAFVALTLGRALFFVHSGRKEGQKVTLLGAVKDDAVTVVILAAVAIALWRGGYLDGDVTLPLHTYGLLVASAFIIGAVLAQREAAKVGLDPERVADLSFWILASALLGAHLYYVLVNHEEFFGPDWLTTTRVVGRWPRFLLPAGMVFYGGFIGAVIGAFFYMRRHRMGFLPYADVLIPSVAFGHFLGRLGCFSAGCCWGEVAHTHLPWLAEFPRASLAYQTFAGRAHPEDFIAPDLATTLPLHPTQLYESFGELAIFLLLVLVVRPRKRFDGQVLAVWLLVYSVLRTVVETFRGDVERGVYFGLGAGQWTSIFILAAGILVWVVGLRARRERLAD
ncbi:MAG: prolipoprotein diacylglyceryl transferase [Anaeromyxobacteraceae bacterium]